MHSSQRNNFDKFVVVDVMVVVIVVAVFAVAVVVAPSARDTFVDLFFRRHKFP